VDDRARETKGKEQWIWRVVTSLKSDWAADNTEKKCELCCWCKGTIGGMECDKWRCHGKGGNMKKQRGVGSP
jgi:hypothetical protein